MAHNLEAVLNLCTNCVLQVFRDEQGNPTIGNDLRLKLSDFAPKCIAIPELEGEDADIVVTSAQLCDFLRDAEEPLTRGDMADSFDSGIVVQKRVPTPSENLEEHYPQASRIIELCKSFQAGTYGEQPPWNHFDLKPGEYEEIQRRINSDEYLWGWVNDKLRYDNDSRTRRLTIRKTTNLHEMFQGQFAWPITKQLHELAKGTGASALFAAIIRCIGHADLEFSSGDAWFSRRSPDASYRCRRARYPGVVLEIAYSEKAQDLGRLAKDWIMDSRGNIRLVIGLDIDYGKRMLGKESESLKAVLSMWRPQFTVVNGRRILTPVQVINDEAFRDDQGNPTNGHLKIRLSDFTYPDLARMTVGEEDHEIVITAEQMCEFLNDAEDQNRRDERMEETGEGDVEEHSPGFTVRWSPSSPSPEIPQRTEPSQKTMIPKVLVMRMAMPWNLPLLIMSKPPRRRLGLRLIRPNRNSL